MDCPHFWLPSGRSRVLPRTTRSAGFDRRGICPLAATQRPLVTSTFTDQSGAPAWATIPSWAIVGMNDHVVTPAEQLFMAHRAHAHITEVSAPTFP